MRRPSLESRSPRRRAPSHGARSATLQCRRAVHRGTEERCSDGRTDATNARLNSARVRRHAARARRHAARARRYAARSRAAERANGHAAVQPRAVHQHGNGGARLRCLRPGRGFRGRTARCADGPGCRPDRSNLCGCGCGCGWAPAAAAAPATDAPVPSPRPILHRMSAERPGPITPRAPVTRAPRTPAGPAAPPSAPPSMPIGPAASQHQPRGLSKRIARMLGRAATPAGEPHQVRAQAAAPRAAAATARPARAGCSGHRDATAPGARCARVVEHRAGTGSSVDPARALASRPSRAQNCRPSHARELG